MKASSPFKMKNKNVSIIPANAGLPEKKKKWCRDEPEKRLPWFDSQKPHTIKRPPAVYTNVQSREQSLEKYLNGE